MSDPAAAALRLAAIVEWSDDAIVSKDLNGIVISWNRAAERMFGYTAAEAIGQSITIIVPPERRSEEAEVLRRIRLGEAVHHFETVRVRKDGSFLPISLTVSPIRDESGRVIGASKIARDISERRRMEAALARMRGEHDDLRARLAALVAGSGELLGSPRIEDVLLQLVELADRLLRAEAYAVWRHDAGTDGWRVAEARGVSGAFAAQTIPAAALASIATHLTEPLAFDELTDNAILYPDPSTLAREGIRSMIAVPIVTGGSVSSVLACYYHTPHAFTDVERQIGSAIGNLAGAAITAAELYDEQTRHRRQAELDHRRATFLAETVATLSGSLDYARTLRALVALAVPHVADWCAVDLNDPPGHVERVAVAHVDPGKIADVHVLQPQNAGTGELSVGVDRVVATATPLMIPNVSEETLADVARDREHLESIRALGLASYICVPLISHGRTIGAMTLAMAESGRHYDTDDLRFAQELAFRAGQAIDNAWAYEQVSAANRAKDEFLATLSHELRTPLNAVLGWARMLRSGSVRPERVPDALDAIERNAAIQLRLIEDLLDVSRVVTGKFKLDIAPMDLAETIRAAVESVQPAAAAKDIHVEVSFDRAAVPMRGDAARLQQAAWNLLSNAIKFTPQHGRVRVSVEHVGLDLSIEVRDSGVGIPAAMLPFVFERFRQGPSSSKGHVGLGLGLAIVRHIIELHGGTVNAASEGVDKGTTFRLELPAAGPAAADASRIDGAVTAS